MPSRPVLRILNDGESDLRLRLLDGSEVPVPPDHGANVVTVHGSSLFKSVVVLTPEQLEEEDDARGS